MKKLLYIIYVLVACISMSSCSHWLDIDPEGQATDNKLTQTGDGYRTMLTGIYKQMASAELYGRELSFGIVDCMSQQYSWGWVYSGSGASNIYQKARAFDYNDVNFRDEVDKIWLSAYNVVANANSLIQDIQNEKDSKFSKGKEEKNMILGEAYACRALIHFDLCRLFAPPASVNDDNAYIPYVDIYPNIQPKSLPTKEVLKKVLEDFNKSLELTAEFDTSALGKSLNCKSESRFHDNLQFGMEGATHPEKIDDFFKGRGYRLNYYAVEALLARYYQYVGNYEKAFEYANKVLNVESKGQYSTIKMFSDDEWYTVESADQENDKRKDLKVESNIVFALYNHRSYEDYNISGFFEKKSESPTGNMLWLMLDLKGQEIFNNAETGVDESADDARAKYLLFKPDFNGLSGDDYMLSGKWYISDDKALRIANFQTLPIIRGTELRYVEAEYYAKKSMFNEAYQILNTIRQNRALYNPLPVKNSMEDFYKDLVRDSQREWIGEGQLFYLYKRLGYKEMINKELRPMTKSEYMLPVPVNQSI